MIYLYYLLKSITIITSVTDHQFNIIKYPINTKINLERN